MEKTRVTEGLDNHETVNVNGILLAVEEKKLHFPSLALGVKGKDILGSSLAIEDEEGLQLVDFPRGFSTPEIEAILNSVVEFSVIHQSFYEGSAGFLQSFEFRLNSSQYGWEVTENITI